MLVEATRAFNSSTVVSLLGAPRAVTAATSANGISVPHNRNRFPIPAIVPGFAVNYFFGSIAMSRCFACHSCSGYFPLAVLRKR